jgi:hypothetical protein
MKTILMELGRDKTTEALEPIASDGSFKGQIINREDGEIVKYIEAFKAGRLEIEYEGRKYKVITFLPNGHFEVQPT